MKCSLFSTGHGRGRVGFQALLEDLHRQNIFQRLDSFLGAETSMRWPNLT